jgi:hypothetical protein
MKYLDLAIANEYLKYYEITKDGKCINKKTNYVKKTFISNSGYERVSLWLNGKNKKFSIHRLVAIKYLKNPNNYEFINHKDGNKLNNNVNNLEWCTNSENMKHAYKTGLQKPKTKRIVQFTKDMKIIKIWNSINEIERELKINHSNIITVCKQNTNRKYAGGYVWRYE